MGVIVHPYSLAEAMELLEAWKSCERALVSGQVKSYRVGTRECTLIDLDDIRAAIRFFTSEINAIQGNVRSRRVATVVPRDL